MLINNKYTNQSNLNCLEKTERTISLLKNFASLSKEEYFVYINELFDIKFDDKDYMKYASFITGKPFTKNVPIQTDIVVNQTNCTLGNERLWFHVLVNESLERKNNYFSLEQIRNLMSQNKIFPLYSCYYPCGDNFKINGSGHDIKCLLTEENGSIIDSKFINFIVSEIKRNLSLHDILLRVQQYIIQSKIELECIDTDNLGEAVLDTINQNKARMDELIDIYNLIIDTYGIKMRHLSKNAIEYIVEYISNLSRIPKEEWYGDITLDQIASVMNNLDYENETVLCKMVQYIVIGLGDPQLLYEMLIKVYWADVKTLAELIIQSKDLECNYYLIDNAVEGLDIQRHAEVIIDSCDAEYNYRLASLAQECDLDLDIDRIGKAVIQSKDCHYNYLFAFEIDGADVRAHGRVIIESGNQHYNNLFATDVLGADIDGHREAYLNLETEKRMVLKPINKD